MRVLTGLLTVVFSLITFFSTAHADVIDPGNPYRKPPRPVVEPIPVTRVYNVRKPDFALTKVEEKDDTYLLRVIVPGPCEWQYNVFAAIDGTTKQIGFGEKISVEDMSRESDTREIVLQIPEGKENVQLLVNVQFCLYRFQETRFGPKLYGTDNKIQGIEHVYELKTVDGKRILKVL